MNNVKMRIFIPFSVGGAVDLYRFQDYVRELYPHSELLTFENFLALKIHITEGEVNITKTTTFSIHFILLGNGIGIFEYIIRRNIRVKSRKAYIGARIDGLLKRKKEFNRTLKNFQTKTVNITDRTRTDISMFYKKMIQDTENEIESLRKETKQ